MDAPPPSTLPWFATKGGTKGARGGAKGGSRGTNWRSGHHGQGGQPQTRAESAFRAAVLALRRAPSAECAAAAAAEVQQALLDFEESSARVDGQLLGMAAAQASRLALKDLLDTLCEFTWSRLSQCGGREVAELVSAAVKHNCGDDKFFHFVGAYCCENPSAFASLRDVALLASSLLKRVADSGAGRGSPKMDTIGTFRGLSVAALPHLRQLANIEAQSCVRDVAEFLYALAYMLDRKGAAHQTPLYHSAECCEAMSAAMSMARRALHNATPQDIAKLIGAAASTWPLMVKLQHPILRPFVTDLVQAIRFRHRDFNAKDVAAVVISFAKLEDCDDVVADVLPPQVEARVSEFSDKDLSLLLWACTRPGWVGKRCTETAVAELQRRDWGKLAVVDLCMAAQALAKLGQQAKAALCLAAGEAFSRQLYKFSTADKALLLWALAKARVMHLALCRLLVRSLAAEGCGSLQRDVVSATLWATAVIYPSLPAGEWTEMLVKNLCAARPWVGASSFEVVNAVWAFGQLPREWVVDAWAPLVRCTEKLDRSELTLHELCNLLSGIALCPQDVDGCFQLLAASIDEIVRRMEGGCTTSTHDKRSLSCMLAILGTDLLLVSRLPNLEKLADIIQKTFAESYSSARAHRGPTAGEAPAAPADQAAGFAPQRPSPARQQPGSSTAQDAGFPGTPTGDHGERQHAGSHGVFSSGNRSRPKSLSLVGAPHHRSSGGHNGTGSHGGFGCTHGQENELDSAQTTPRRGGLLDVDDEGYAVQPADAVGLGAREQEESSIAGLRVNRDCDFTGHCVQVRNSFIHIECGAWCEDDEEEDCAICGALGTRPRARSVDHLELLCTRSHGSHHSPGNGQREEPGDDRDRTSCDDRDDDKAEAPRAAMSARRPGASERVRSLESTPTASQRLSGSSSLRSKPECAGGAAESPGKGRPDSDPSMAKEGLRELAPLPPPAGRLPWQ